MVRGVPKLCDFGESRSADGRLRMTTGIGTALYMAPEVGRRGVVYGTPSDIYSFGVLFVEMLLREDPHIHDRALQVNVAVERLGASGLIDHEECARLLQACLARAADERPSAYEAASILERILDRNM